MHSMRASPSKVYMAVLSSGGIGGRKSTDRECQTLCTGVHSLHVHVGPEHGHGTVGVPVSLESLEERLGIMENGCGGAEINGGIYDMSTRQTGEGK